MQRIDAAPTVAALATLRLHLTQSERMTPEFDTAITERIAFMHDEAARETTP
ncbi:MAG: hypothetical protein WCD38_11805 [Candidatus Tumulicola sp.]